MRSGLVPDRGDILFLDGGAGQRGRAPALIVSPRAYNRATGLALACPIIQTPGGYPFEVLLPGSLGIAGAVLADRPQSLDWRSRRPEFAAHAPKAVLEEIAAKIAVLLE